MALHDPLRDKWQTAVERTGAPAGLALAAVMVVVAFLRFGVLPTLGVPADSALQHRLFVFDTAHLSRVWTVVTSMLAHGSVLHLLVAGQLVVGFSTLVEPKLGSYRLLGVFAATALCALVSGAALDIVAGYSGTYVGSSGGGFGLLGWLVGYAPRERLPTVPPGPAWIVAGLVGVASLGIVGVYGIGAFGIAHTAHVAGLLAGVALGVAAR